ncbi:MAG: hypothetical protein Q8K64_16375 [Sediminibacterium sp.]|nr:hypothetical protein [Sediminibacterium sp.]
MVFLFRDKSVINILFLIILSLLVHAHFFFVAPVLLGSVNEGLFAVFLIHYFSSIDTTFLFILYLAALLIQAIRLNMLLMELKMFQKLGYTVAMSYVLLSGFFISWTAITPALFANFLLIWLFIKITRLFNQPNPKNLLFNIGLIVGSTILCYHPTAILIIVVLFTLGIMRPFKLQEWFVLLMGIALPYYLLGSWLFLNDRLGEIYAYLPHWALVVPAVKMDAAFIVGISVLAIAFIVGFICWQQFNSRLVIQIRKNWSAMLLMCLILLAVPFVFRDGGLPAAFMCILPLSVFISNAFSYPQKLFLPNLLFWGMFGVVMYNNWQIIKF